jgi:hypothetical protein
VAKSQPRKSDTETLDTGSRHTPATGLIRNYIHLQVWQGGVHCPIPYIGTLEVSAKKIKKSNPPRVKISGSGASI